MPRISAVSDVRVAQEVIKSAGIDDLVPKREEVSDALSQYGANLSECCKVIAEVMTYSDKEIIRLRAADLALKLHGVNSEETKKDSQKILFVIQDGTVNLQNILNPQR